MLAARQLVPSRAVVARRYASLQTVPSNSGKRPPTLEEFDPLNPGEWQLGASGRILPRLPEGTRVGKLVMGKYGLYDPVLRKKIEVFSKALDEGAKSEDAGPANRFLSRTSRVLAFSCFFLGLYNLVTLLVGHPLPPLQNLKPPGSA